MQVAAADPTGERLLVWEAAQQTGNRCQRRDTAVEAG